MKICLIGAGRIGAVHAIAIASDENANLHSIVDFDQESAERLANKYNAITLSMDEAFENNEIEILVEKNNNPKCERCWHMSDTVGTIEQHPLLCSRCHSNVYADGEQRTLG